MEVKKGDLITIDLAEFINYYALVHEFCSESSKYIVALVISDVFREDDFVEYDEEWASERIYKQKMYRVYLHGRIIPIYAKDIGERL